jgi:hypothetical protein
MTPGPSAGNSPWTASGTLWVFLRRIAIIVGIVIVIAPFVDTLAHIVKTEIIGRVDANSLRPSGLLIITGITSLPRRLISPGIQTAFALASRCSLPLRFGGEAKIFSGSLP